MDPSKSSNVPQSNSSEKQPAPPPHQVNPGYPNPAYSPNPSGYPAPSGGQPYGQAPYPGKPPITVEPTVYVAPTPLAHPLPDYLCYSIFNMICSCLPLGIAALVYSISTRNANISGLQQIAEKNSRIARILNHSALGIGLTILVLYIIYIVVYLQNHAGP
nr:synapse differentiation-inducing gene protein 1-like [Misgurnus anguillicaudatus]XP_055067132.1 synapse differentiation-inducing gene protein 1-like [Misgurnus anguillicaudatus]